MLQTLENSTANNVVLEAMACGLPVVAERVGGISEYVSRENAILTEPNDVDTLVRAIRVLADSHGKLGSRWAKPLVREPNNFIGRMLPIGHEKCISRR